MKIVVAPCWKDGKLFRLYIDGTLGQMPVGPRLFRGEVDKAMSDTPYVYHTKQDAQAGADKLNQHFTKHMEARAKQQEKSKAKK